MTSPDSARSGLSDSLPALGADLLALVCARGELIAIELQEERARIRQKLVLGMLAGMFFALGMLLAAFLVVVVFWDTHRALATGGAALLYLCIGAGAFLRLREIDHRIPSPFSATLNEFSNDLNLLRGRDA